MAADRAGEDERIMFQFFEKRPDLNEGVQMWKDTPGSVLLDVRTREEFIDGHVPGSINLPLEQLAEIDIPKQTPLFVYCHSGNRSGQAAAWLVRQGYTATNVGGIIEYSGILE